MGAKITIIQSYRNSMVPDWIVRCMESVRSFAKSNRYNYQIYTDEQALEILSSDFKAKVGHCWPMKMDLARLIFCKKELESGVQKVIWLDADVLIIDPERFNIEYSADSGFAIAREIWIEESGKVRRGIHNAFLMFERDNPFLNFYIHACNQIIKYHSGEFLAPQLLGPKFLKMQKPFIGGTVDQQVEMWSPWVIADPTLFEKQRVLEGGIPIAANLCHSMDAELDRDRFVEEFSKR